MIVVLMKGKTKQVIASPASKGWIVAGDKHWPCTELKSESAFITRWKQLKKQGYKDAEYISSKPKTRARKQKYVVKATGTMDPVFKAFAAWVKPQEYGAVGYFEVITGKVPKRICDDADLVAKGRALMHLPDGSLIAANAAGQIFFLDSEGGKPKRLAADVRAFLAKLAKGKTGAMDLDDKAATGRKALAAWLAEQ